MRKIVKKKEKNKSSSHYFNRKNSTLFFPHSRQKTYRRIRQSKLESLRPHCDIDLLPKDVHQQLFTVNFHHVEASGSRDSSGGEH